MAFRANTYTGVDSQHKVIFSRVNTSDGLARAVTFDHTRQSFRYSDVDVEYEDGEFENDTVMTNILDSKDNTMDGNTSSLTGWMGDENRWNFLCFCVGVSLSTAPVVSTLFWALVLLNHRYAGIGNGCFFLVYAVTSLCFAKSIVNYLGSTRTFIVCHVGNVIYCICFMIEFTVLFQKFDIDLSSHVSLYPVVASIGGLSQSLMSTAHMKYFNRCAQMMLNSMNISAIQNLNRSLASTFAFIYFTTLCLTFAFGVIVIYEDAPPVQLLSVYMPLYMLTVAVSSYCFLRLDDMGDRGEQRGNFQLRRGLLDVITGVRLMSPTTYYKLLCLFPYSVAWGSTNSFWVYYIVGVVVKDEQNLIFIGITYVIDFSVSLVFSYASDKMTKCLSSSQIPMILWGWMCMTTIGLLVLTLSNNELGTKRRIVGCAVIHGMARAVYENNHKAAIANFFSETQQATAYSVSSFVTMFTAGITFFYYAFLETRVYFGVIVIITSALGMIGYVTANFLHQHEILEDEDSMRSSSASLITIDSDSQVMFVADYF